MLVNIKTLEPWRGEKLMTEMTRASLRFEDGRVEIVDVDPYLVAVRYPLNIEQLWADVDLAKIGLARVIPATCPEGMQFVGDVRYERDGKGVRAVRDVEPLPPLPETVTITREEHDRLVEAAEQWRVSELAKVPRADSDRS